MKHIGPTRNDKYVCVTRDNQQEQIPVDLNWKNVADNGSALLRQHTLFLATLIEYFISLFWV